MHEKILKKSSEKSSEKTAQQPTSVLDLTDKQTLFELAMEPRELLGSAGAKLIADLAERAMDADYTHLYYRDPIRPGMIWFTPLVDDERDYALNLPTRGKIDECRFMTDLVFPGLCKRLERLKRESEMAPPRSRGDDHGFDSTGTDCGHDSVLVMQDVPPLILSPSSSITSFELVTALEYIVFVYPEMVRAWASLIFAYEHLLGLVDAAKSTREACLGTCKYAQVVAHLIQDTDIVC